MASILMSSASKAEDEHDSVSRSSNMSFLGGSRRTGVVLLGVVAKSCEMTLLGVIENKERMSTTPEFL
ncbi:uncharacterized protein G2W53_000475 [Senna tora]|uniref:Uncharacterized protein n=1 Tax=Senna tora TaxID=362788 RepID=A0A835CKL7_9FABA|nr:uncharacterized protein G2W53_000475 [Senna tora]